MFADLPDRIRHCVRPEVRREKAYHVGGVGQPEVKLNQNESQFDLPQDLKQELLSAFLAVPFNRYPSEQPDDLAEALAAHTGHPASGLLIGNGSNELTYTLGLALIAPGAQVLLPRPMFALFSTMARIFGGTILSEAPREDLTFDAAALLSAVTREQPALTVLTTPNNPTGRAMNPADIEAIVAAADGIVLVDEAYVEFNPHGSMQHLLADHPNMLIMRTLSKAFGLAGLRIGYLMGHPELIGELLKARLPFMVDRMAVATAVALLGNPALITERIASIGRSTRWLYEALAAVDGIDVYPTETNFLLFRTPLAAEEMLLSLQARGVLVRNMGGYPELKGLLRVSAGTDQENQRFLAALTSALSEKD